MAAARSRSSEKAATPHVEDHVYTWLNKHGRHLLRGGVAVLAVVVVVAIIVGVDKSRRRQAAEAAATAYAPLDEVLAKPLATGMMGEVDTEAIGKRRTAFEDAIAKYPDSQAAIDARLQLAALDFRAGDYTAAADAFKAFVADHPNREPQTSLARLGQGDSLLAAGQLEDALKVYDTAANDIAQTANPPAADRARVKAALVQAMLGRPDEARNNLNLVLASNSPFVKQTAESMLERLTITPPEQWRRLAASLDKPKAEEPKAEEPKAEEPKAEEPKAE